MAAAGGVVLDGESVSAACSVLESCSSVIIGNKHNCFVVACFAEVVVVVSAAAAAAVDVDS